MQLLSSEESCTDSAQLALSEHCILLAGPHQPIKFAEHTGNKFLSQEIEEVTRGCQTATSVFKQGGTG